MDLFCEKNDTLGYLTACGLQSERYATLERLCAFYRELKHWMTFLSDGLEAGSDVVLILKGLDATVFSFVVSLLL